MQRTRPTVVILLALAVGACGGSSSPDLPTPIPSPSPTPRPPVTITLSAPSDHYFFSVRLTQLTTARFFDVAFTPRSIDQVEGEAYSHSIEFWLMEATGSANAADLSTDGIALSLSWSRGEWRLSSRTPAAGYQSLPTRVPIAFGEQRTVRIIRHSAEVVEFQLDGTSVLTLRGSAPPNIFARVVGAEASFTYSVE